MNAFKLGAPPLQESEHRGQHALQHLIATTASSVTFTVDSETYFDGQGSTIKFSVVETQEGYVLRREAIATDVNVFAAVAVFYGGATIPWELQAVRLREAVLRESGGR
ncbi:MAG: hypothetical protein K0S37_14 [Microbacterium sp.]|nr:hypothetical protein [Microbacterium sp.]